jgi:hypothetical protein
MRGNDSPRYAVFSFFKLNGCPPCNNFFGHQQGTDEPNPDGPWASLASDRELVDKDGVEFALFKFGTVKNAAGTEVVDFLEVPKVYEQRVTSAPYLEMRVPNDLTNGIRYMGDRSNWQSVKSWVEETLNTPPFKSYREAVQQGRIPPMTSSDIKRQFEIIKDAPDIQTSDREVAAFNKSLEQTFNSRNGRQQEQQSQRTVYQEPQQRQYTRQAVNVRGMGTAEMQQPIDTGDVRSQQYNVRSSSQQSSQPSPNRTPQSSSQSPNKSASTPPKRFMPANYDQ